jgi:hypothetical protein
MAAEEAVREDVEQAQDGDAKRERSTIKFPYGDLSDAVEVAKGVHTVGGTSCEWEQLAAHLKLAATGGGFRMKMLTAKIFGVADYGQRKVTLTQLGSRLNDPKQEAGARVEAFLSVPLYKTIYNKFKGATLPPTSALEAEMAGMGVAEKQTDKARQYFQRSAEQAGFFWSGQDRLVTPATGPNGGAGGASHEQEERERVKRHGGGSGGGGGLHPLIDGLIKTLPDPETDWPIEKRAKWLRAAAQNFDLIYKDAGDDSIEITVQKGSAK